MKDSKRLADYVPDGAAVAAAAMVVAAALLPIAVFNKLELLAASTVTMAMGWLWTIREQRAAKRQEDSHAARLVEEKVEVERLLDAAINSQIASSVDVDLKRTLKELANTLAAELAACYLPGEGHRHAPPPARRLWRGAGVAAGPPRRRP